MTERIRKSQARRDHETLSRTASRLVTVAARAGDAQAKYFPIFPASPDGVQRLPSDERASMTPRRLAMTAECL
jgi:hypothetical protein